jgi:hypothetical protein
MNYLAFRYWWFIWLLFLMLLLLYFFFSCNTKTSTKKYENCAGRATYYKNLKEIDSLMLNCCECSLDTISNREEIISDSLEIDSIPQPPKQNCRVHFSGLIMGGKYVHENISEIYREDYASEYVGAGFYANNTSAFPKSVRTTFDGIAIDKGTQLIIYSKPNFRGSVLLDIKGPAIINNVKWKNDSRYNPCNTENYTRNLQSNFPQSVRYWSKSDMHAWSYGSCKIICSN